jgi:hypothetical protein
VYIPNGGQVEFHAAIQQYRRVCAIGGVRSGKSLAGCIEAFLQAMEYPGSQGVVIRWSNRQLLSSTWRILKSIIPGGVPGPMVIRCNQSPGATFMDLRAPGGEVSRITGWAASITDAIASMELDWAFCDEINTYPTAHFNDFWGYLITRLSSPLGCNRLWAAGNPTNLGPLYHRFVRKGYRDHKLVVMPTSVNRAHLPPGYEEEQRRTNTRDWARRMLDGEFLMQDGQILSKWNPTAHVVPRFEPPSHWPTFVSIDPGQRDACCALLYRTDEEGRIWFIDEFYRAGLTIPEQCKGILQMVGGAKIDRVVIDPSAGHREASSGIQRIDLYREGLPGVNIVPAPNRIDASIEVLQKLLTVNPAVPHPVTGNLGSPSLFVTENCRHLREEIPNWVWDARTGRPKKGTEHAVDAARYACTSRPHAAPPKVAELVNPDWENFWNDVARTEGWGEPPRIGSGAGGRLGVA